MSALDKNEIKEKVEKIETLINQKAKFNDAIKKFQEIGKIEEKEIQQINITEMIKDEEVS